LAAAHQAPTGLGSRAPSAPGAHAGRGSAAATEPGSTHQPANPFPPVPPTPARRTLEAAQRLQRHSAVEDWVHAPGAQPRRLAVVRERLDQAALWGGGGGWRWQVGCRRVAMRRRHAGLGRETFLRRARPPGCPCRVPRTRAPRRREQSGGLCWGGGARVPADERVGKPRGRDLPGAPARCLCCRRRGPPRPGPSCGPGSRSWGGAAVRGGGGGGGWGAVGGARAAWVGSGAGTNQKGGRCDAV
jgi:hypothetical protein